MKAQRVCNNCGVKISLFKSIIHNKCCSYICDCKLEEKIKAENELKWRQHIVQGQLNSIYNHNYKNPNNFKYKAKYDEDDYDYDKNITSEINNELNDNEFDVDEFYTYCLTDDNDEEDYTY